MFSSTSSRVNEANSFPSDQLLSVKCYRPRLNTQRKIKNSSITVTVGSRETPRVR